MRKIEKLWELFTEQRSPIRLSDNPLVEGSAVVAPQVERKAETRRIKFMRRGEKEVRELDEEEFRLVAGLIYLPELGFENEKTFQRIRKQCEKALKNGYIGKASKWLGTLHAPQIRSRAVADVSIRWMDERLGYGLFAERKIEAGECIGEYTGVVRRLKFIFHRCNDYCFSYPTSDSSIREHIIDAQNRGNEMRYANHSDSPNCETRGVFCDGLLHIIVRSIQDIPSHGQITYDYTHHYWQRRTPVPNLTQDAGP